MTPMSQIAKDPLLPADDAARALAHSLLLAARHAALAFADPGSGAPGISRIALGLDPEGCPISLVSTLSQHTPALRADPRCALMVGEVGEKGDPLSHPRLMIQARAAFLPPGTAEHAALRAHWLKSHPKSALYIDFADFSLVRLVPDSALLNAGFGRAHRLDAADLQTQAKGVLRSDCRSGS